MLVPLRLAVAPELDAGEVEARALLLDRAPVPVLVVDVPVEPPLTPDVPVVLETPEHGATVADVSELALVEEISTPATLQLAGICCSMISTKLIGPTLAVVPVVVVVEVLVPVPELVPVVPDTPAALEGLELAPVAAPEAPVDAPVAAPVAPVDAPVAAPEARAELEAPDTPVVVVVVVEVLVLGALRMSMNATVCPLLDRFMKVPSIGIDELLLVLVLVVLPALDVPDVLAAPVEPVGLANDPDHWFCVSIC